MQWNNQEEMIRSLILFCKTIIKIKLRLWYCAHIIMIWSHNYGFPLHIMQTSASYFILLLLSLFISLYSIFESNSFCLFNCRLVWWHTTWFWLWCLCLSSSQSQPQTDSCCNWSQQALFPKATVVDLSCNNITSLPVSTNTSYTHNHNQCGFVHVRASVWILCYFIFTYSVFACVFSFLMIITDWKI